MDPLWCFSPDHGQLCQVIEAQTLWGETTCRVWLPGSDTVVRIPASRLKSLESTRAGFKKAWQEGDYGTIIAVARRIPDDVLQEDPKLLMWYDQAVT